MKTADFRIQSSPVDAPSAGFSTVFSDASGVLKFIKSTSETFVVGQVFENFLSGNIGGSVSTGVTGNVHNAGANFLGSTATMFTVTGPSGQRFAIPAYLVS